MYLLIFISLIFISLITRATSVDLNLNPSCETNVSEQLVQDCYYNQLSQFRIGHRAEQKIASSYIVILTS